MNFDFEITIDGRTAGVLKGETILQVARRMGIDVPVFCWHPRIDPVGACRMCLVQVEKIPKLVVACATPAGPNMVVHTRNDQVDKARKGVLEFLLIDHPLDCPTCDKGGECTLQNNVYHYGLDRSRFTETKVRWERDERYFLDDVQIGPQIIRNMNRCIRCYRCTRFTQEIAGEGDLGIFNRGWRAEIDTLPDRQIGNLFSGNTVEICPVGALMSEDFRYKTRPWISYRTPSICNLCSDGCNLTLWNNRRRLFRATSRANPEVDEGWICDRGRYAYAYRQSADRITEPQERQGEGWKPVEWAPALDGAAVALRGVLRAHGPGAIGGMVSPTTSNEGIYLFQRFMRSVLGSNSIDWRVDRKRLADPERRRVHRAFPRQNRPLAWIDRTDLIVAFGCDLENERPISGLRALKAQRQHGARIVLVNNRPTRLRRKADDEWIYRPQTERLVWSGLLKLIAAERPDSVPAELREALGSVDLERVAQRSGMAVDSLRDLASRLCRAERCLIILGRDIRQAGDQEAIVDLALAAGELLGLDGGERGAVELSPEYSNAIGATLMGAEPEVLPGGIEGQDTRHAARLAELWGGDLPAAGGFDATEMLEAAHDNRLKALLLVDTNPLFHCPDTAWVEEALSRLDCIIALGKFDLGHPGFAHYFLPTTTVHEEGGTLISGEGRLQYFEAAVRTAGGARPVREVLSELSARLDRSWDFGSSQMVFREMGSAIDALQDVSHVQLREGSGLRLDLDQYSQEADSLMPAAAAALALPGPDAAPPDDDAFYLVTGNVGHHFGHLTHQSEPIMNFASVPYALLHPEDCRELDLETGQWITVRGARGRIEVTARPSPLVARRMILIPVHYPQANPNRLRGRSGATDYVTVQPIADREPERLEPRVAIAEVGAWTF